MNEVKLLPCPFDGAPALYRQGVRVFDDKPPSMTAYCSNEKCVLHRVGFTLEEWNTRDSAALEVTNDHTTHFDDCGCKSAKYEAKLAHLQERLDEAEKLLREARFFHEDVSDCFGNPCKWCQDLAEYRAKIGDTTPVDDGREIQGASRGINQEGDTAPRR